MYIRYMNSRYPLFLISSRLTRLTKLLLQSYSLKTCNIVSERGIHSITIQQFNPVSTSRMADESNQKPMLTIVTGNQNKLKEIQAILGEDFPYELVANPADLPEYQGEADTVSSLKCKAAYELIGGPVVVEDTCLCFNGLKGLPGPYIKWFLKKLGPEGLFKMLKGFDDHSAYALATLAYTNGDSEQDVILFKGITEGTIVHPRGDSGFGWDSCFQPTGYDKTYAEMSSEDKNKISHRKRAVEAMRDHFKK